MPEEEPIVYDTQSQLPEKVVSEGSMLWNKTGSWRYIKPRYMNKVPPCNQGCPAGNDIENFIQQIGLGDPAAAWRILKEENPFPKVCGRVCYHPCESVCNRDEFDRAIAIHALERFAAEHAPPDERPAKLRPDSSKRVAIVGSGPAGLTAAYHLARMGHSVTVFEAKEKPGGLMRYGIPGYRLPQDVLEAEIDDIRSLGVKMKCKQVVGRDVAWDEMKAFSAVFLSIGVHKNRLLGFASEGARGVRSGLEFLDSVARGDVPALGEKTVIVGGGNAAIDAARCALRLGSEVSIYYHRSRKEMPAFEEEVYEAEREGVAIHFLAQPVDIITEDNRAVGFQFRKALLGEQDPSGRRTPVPIPGTEFDVSADTIITAIGETSDLAWLPPDLQTEQGRIVIDQFGLTNHPGVFAGGDTALTTHNVAYAIGSGKAAACAIDSSLNDKPIENFQDRIIVGGKGAVSVSRYLETGKAHAANDSSGQVVAFSELNLNYFEPQARRKTQKLSIAERMTGFEEVNGGLSDQHARLEADRCFHCGVCTLCDNCYVFCPDVAVTKNSQMPEGYEIVYDYCKGCGICVYECPRSAMIMEDE
ncbi:MAG: NAD(P)-binding protein [Desulfobacterales bacterium]